MKHDSDCYFVVHTTCSSRDLPTRSPACYLLLLQRESEKVELPTRRSPSDCPPQGAVALGSLLHANLSPPGVGNWGATMCGAPRWSWTIPTGRPLKRPGIWIITAEQTRHVCIGDSDDESVAYLSRAGFKFRLLQRSPCLTVSMVFSLFRGKLSNSSLK